MEQEKTKQEQNKDSNKTVIEVLEQRLELARKGELEGVIVLSSRTDGNYTISDGGPMLQETRVYMLKIGMRTVLDHVLENKVTSEMVFEEVKKGNKRTGDSK